MLNVYRHKIIDGLMNYSCRLLDSLLPQSERHLKHVAARCLVWVYSPKAPKLETADAFIYLSCIPEPDPYWISFCVCGF